MKQPQRLTNEQYMSLSSSFRLFKQRLSSAIELHWHEFYEMSFITSGRGTQTINGESSRLVPGTLFLLTPADFHEVRIDEGEELELYNLIFSAEVLKDEITELLFSTMRRFRTELTDTASLQVEREFVRIWEESQRWGAGSRLVVEGAIERVLIDLYRACEGEAIPAAAEGRAVDAAIRKAVVFIQHHFREPLTLELAAASCNLSPNYFSECFHHATGVPFQTYLVNTRLEFAKSLLKVSRISITEACLASGFNTLAHFERMFKRRYQCTPKQFRIQAGV